jgi:hypothetical protein
MRTRPLLVIFLLACSAALMAESKSAFVNSKVSSRTITLNQPVRVEFTTSPRQIAGIDIQQSVVHALELGPALESWRVLVPPVIDEQGKNERDKTVKVSFSLLPRESGDRALPQIPLAWLNGDQVAEFGTVSISANIQVGTDLKPVPKETTAVSGFKWGSKVEDVISRLGETTKAGPNRLTAHPEKNLELAFLNGELAEATISAPGLTLDQARDSFINRWGLPQTEGNGAITWIVGWTKITAQPSAGDTPGTQLRLAREDILGRQNKARVNVEVFDLLDRGQSAEERKQEEIKDRNRHIDDAAKRATEEYLKNKPKIEDNPAEYQPRVKPLE